MLSKNSSVFLARFGIKTPLSREWKIAILLALGSWLFYAFASPGLDYYGCYTRMVRLPEDLALVATTHVWTLNPAWIIPFLAPFVYLPGKIGLIVFLGFTLIITLIGTAVFKGRPIIALLSNQMWWVLYWGQIEAFGILALVLGWYALKKNSWWMMTLALLMGAFKPQLTLIPILLLWWWSGKARWPSLAVCVLVAVLSVVIWGPWPYWYYQGIIRFVGDNHYAIWNASIGYWALPLFLPALLLPMERLDRIKVIAATTMLCNPYMPYYSTLPLLIFVLPWPAYIFAFTGYLVTLIGPRLSWNSIVMLPILTLVWAYYPHFLKGIHKAYPRLKVGVPSEEEKDE
jgi:hypothetical protein